MIKNRFSGLISLFVLVIFVVTAYTTPTAFATDSLDMYSDEEINIYNDSINVFKHLDIFEVDDDVQKIVTRSQFVTLMLDYLGVSDYLDTASVKGTFKDLSENENAYKIEYAVENGLISAYSRDEFKPDDYILFEEAVTALVSGLGYDKIIKSESGLNADTTAYLTKAVKLGLLKGVNQNMGYPIAYGKLMKLFENALTAKLVGIKYSNKNTAYYVSDNSTILSEIYNAEERKGIVTANGYTDIINGGDVAVDTIRIDDVEYKYPDASSSLIGHKVKYYVREEDGAEKLLYVDSLLEDGDFLYIPSDQIIRYRNRTYEYYNSRQRTDTQEIPVGCVVIYNGRTITNSFALGNDILTPENGSVMFIDNNGDKKYDILIVESFETYIVESIDKENMEIFDKLDSTKHVSLKAVNGTSVIVEDLSKNPLSAQKIKIGQVLSVAKSADGKMVKAIISDKTVSGVIDRINKDSLVINDTEYKINPDNNQLFVVSKNGKFLLDKDDKIVYFEETADVSMGYLINAKVESGLSGKLVLKVLTDSGSIDYLYCAKTVRLNDVRITDYTVAYNTLAGLGMQTVFTYNLNSDGEICKLYTLYSGTERQCPPERLQLNTTIADNMVTYTSWPMSFNDSKTFLDGSTVIFCVPDNPQSADEDLFYVCRADSLSSDAFYSSAEKPLTSYNLGGEVLIASCMVINSDFLLKDYRIGIVCDITSTIDENESIYTNIGIFNYGSIDSYYLYVDEGIDINALGAGSVSYSSDTYKLELGDVVLYDYEDRGSKRVLKRIKVLYDVNSKDYLYKNPPNTSVESTSTYYFGDVYEKNGKYISVVLSGGELTGTSIGTIGDNFDKTNSNYFVEYIGGATICKYSTKGKYPTVSLEASSDEIIPYTSAGQNASKIFVFTNRGNSVFCYIVE